MGSRTIAFVFVCKGRLAHLRETLPLAVRQAPDEILVVDYDCPDGAGEWVRSNYPGVKVVNEYDRKAFNLARSRNIGACNVQSEFVLFIDADIKTNPGLVSWLRSNLERGYFYTCLNSSNNTKKGTFCCAKKDFDAVGGYDEAISVYGNEDTDLYARLLYSKTKMRDLPAGFLTAIAHDDSLRTQHYPVKAKSNANAISNLYVALKHHLLANDMDFDLESRDKIFSHIVDKYDDYKVDGKLYFNLDINSDLPEMNIEIKELPRFRYFGRKFAFVRVNGRSYKRLRRLFAGDFARRPIQAGKTRMGRTGT